jgi:hypothetical protein
MKPFFNESEFAPTAMPETAPQSLSAPASVSCSSTETPLIDLRPEVDLPLKHDAEARLFGRFCCEVIARLDASKSKLIEWRRITEDYNAGRLVPELLRLKDSRSERTLRIWLQIYLEHNCDIHCDTGSGTVVVETGEMLGTGFRKEQIHCDNLGGSDCHSQSQKCHSGWQGACHGGLACDVLSADDQFLPTAHLRRDPARRPEGQDAVLSLFDGSHS